MTPPTTEKTMISAMVQAQSDLGNSLQVTCLVYTLWKEGNGLELLT